MDIKNDSELIKAMNAILEAVITNVSKKILKHLQDNVVKYVYDIQNPKMYERTFEFLEAWDWGQIYKQLNTMTRELSYHPEGMTKHSSWGDEPSSFIHGNAKYGDARKTLMDILNRPKFPPYTSKGVYGKRGLLLKKSKAYWDITIKQLFDDGLIENWLKAEFSNYSIRKS